MWLAPYVRRTCVDQVCLHAGDQRGRQRRRWRWRVGPPPAPRQPQRRPSLHRRLRRRRRRVGAPTHPDGWRLPPLGRPSRERLIRGKRDQTHRSGCHCQCFQRGGAATAVPFPPLLGWPSPETPRLEAPDDSPQSRYVMVTIIGAASGRRQMGAPCNPHRQCRPSLGRPAWPCLVPH